MKIIDEIKCIVNEIIDLFKNKTIEIKFKKDNI